MARILAIETATEACSAALLCDNEILHRYELAPQQHARLILPMVESLLAEAGCTLAQLDCLAFGRGPGSFTGVRIAASVIQGLAYAIDRPVVPVSSLAALAQQISDEHAMASVLTSVLTAIDARMGQVYWGVYRRGDDQRVALQGEERVCDPDQVAAVVGEDWLAAGSGWDRYAEVLQAQAGVILQAQYPQAMPHARGVVTLARHQFDLGNAVSAALAQPVYLRNDVAKKMNRA